ncbi:MAG: peptidoglycan DD-metalloendopeptidase family protein [Prolixibacteraceae bacterium]|jgi:murein hydrolase activator|nr:peptidoglycan DD-metalloendopeptidase family protein [Prolixibacteraceae bacterium]MBT6005452.1 peptidoglycan DD-metalloendopeptidase family protein [Prolixibacteraceae bacterium]MBT6766223.1 peptidoglycan DD-metalloendopeptidase family protein [Prolixibacteraceae bacterium]MBT7000553.1 peptidoglycan DD-metalloendopeptidase family protein [Prolixibacteraceae bacterium]MBT7393501.1 peptidoglycan DD-metalloendopeptidase family protein [Prolixibacteraceae bacterium]
MKALVLISLFLIFQKVGFAQSITDLQEKKQNAVKEIKYTTNLLNQVQKNEKESLTRLRLLSTKINQRNVLISSINEETKLFQEFIENNNFVVEMLSEDIVRIKNEYAILIRSAYRNKNANDEILFLLSAENFNQAHRRFLYLKRYTSYRKKQAETIEIIQTILSKKSAKLEQQKQIKEKLIGQTQHETTQLGKEKNQQSSVIQKLQSQQKELSQKLKLQHQIERQLESEIQRFIEEEARKNLSDGSLGFALTPEQKLVGDNFEQNKQRLPWPTERGIITEHFGIHQHPVLTNVQIRNNGINIATEIGAKIRAVFNGEVSRVFGITGGNTAVIIRHGKFLSVYSNLREVNVKKGDIIKTKQNIGTIFTDHEDGNKSILKFQIWRENQKLDPEQWIVK